MLNTHAKLVHSWGRSKELGREKPTVIQVPTLKRNTDVNFFVKIHDVRGNERIQKLILMHTDKYTTYGGYRDGGYDDGYSRMMDMIYSEGFCPVAVNYFTGFLHLLTVCALRATDGAKGNDQNFVAQMRANAETTLGATAARQLEISGLVFYNLIASKADIEEIYNTIPFLGLRSYAALGLHGSLEPTKLPKTYEDASLLSIEKCVEQLMCSPEKVIQSTPAALRIKYHA